jgi:hypothetical protein
MTIVVVITYTELLFIEYTELLKKVKTKILLKNGIYYGAVLNVIYNCYYLFYEANVFRELIINVYIVYIHSFIGKL